MEFVIIFTYINIGIQCLYICTSLRQCQCRCRGGSSTTMVRHMISYPVRLCPKTKSAKHIGNKTANTKFLTKERANAQPNPRSVPGWTTITSRGLPSMVVTLLQRTTRIPITVLPGVAPPIRPPIPLCSQNVCNVKKQRTSFTPVLYL